MGPLHSSTMIKCDVTESFERFEITTEYLMTITSQGWFKDNYSIFNHLNIEL